MLTAINFEEAFLNRPLSLRCHCTVGLSLLLIAPLAFLIDLPLAIWAKEQAYPKALVKACNLSEIFAHGFGVLIIAWVITLLDGRGWRRGLTVLIAALSAGLAGDVIKLLIFRTRPRDFDFSTGILTTFQEWLPVATRHVEHLSSSFPSSHAATAAGLAFVLMLLYPKGRPAFAVLFFLACAQRVFAGAHFLSDVLFGAGIGWSAAFFVLSTIVPISWWSSAVPQSQSIDQNNALGKPVK